MEKRAAIQKQGADLRQLLRKSASENQYNLDAVRHNLSAKVAEEKPLPYKNAAFIALIRGIDSLVGLALEGE